MNRYIGKVVSVFLPEQYKNGNLLDVMDGNLIGFKIKIDEYIKTIELEQNDINSQILKDDLVIVTEQIISGKNFIDIELYDGE